MLQPLDARMIGDVVAPLLGADLDAIAQVRKGRNNQIFRVAAGGREFAIKHYPPQTSDRRDRLAAEYRALSFLHAHGVRNVPTPIARSDLARVAVYEWVDGHTPRAGERGGGDLAGFFVQLLTLRERALSSDIGLASASCLSLSEAIQQLKMRREALREVELGHADLAEYLRGFDEASAQTVARAVSTAHDAGIEPSTPLPASLRCLSPSDFGFHNALVRADGDLVFLDFEYFGWDDPVKAVADIMLHPGMELSHEDGVEAYNAIANALAGEDRRFRERFELFYPICALIWCLIILNEFLPVYATRREAAGAFDGGKSEMLTQQLAKADRRLHKVAHGNEHAITA